MLYVKTPSGQFKTAREDDVIIEAILIYNQYFQKGNALTSPLESANYLKLKLAQYEHEVFLVLFLNNQHQVISCDELFRGTIDAASVYPREVVKAALFHNAKAVIFAHNHPSGIAEPSSADLHITERLKAALALVEIAVLDHLIVGAGVYSLAEHGKL